MAGTRSKILRAKIQVKLNDPRGIGIGRSELVYDTLNKVQYRILEQTGARQTTQTLNVVSGTELYNLPSGFIAIAALVPNPTDGSVAPLTCLNIQQVEDIKTSHNLQTQQLVDSGSPPMYYYIWGNQIGVMNADGSAPNQAMTISLYGWMNTKTDGSEDMSDSVDPILDSRWDIALYYG